MLIYNIQKKKQTKQKRDENEKLEPTKSKT